ncbi:MAG: hypothetical protein KF722_08390 [Nitrospira sp.]|nr:hypothetical protein [Nitrospira sp.]
MADQHTHDVRIEAALAKFAPRRLFKFLKDSQVIFGGMGYETAHSKWIRGEPAFGIEQLVRDAEMYRIGEGATDILRPFVAREGLNMHLERVGRLFDERTTGVHRLIELQRLLRFYAPWYVSQWRSGRLPSRPEFHHPNVRSKLIFVERASRRLARTIFYAMLLHRQALRDDQGRQNRIEMIGENLLVIATTALYAEAQVQTAAHPEVWELVEECFREAKQRVEQDIKGLIRNQDTVIAAVGGKALNGRYPSLLSGIIRRNLQDYSRHESVLKADGANLHTVV